MPMRVVTFKISILLIRFGGQEQVDHNMDAISILLIRFTTSYTPTTAATV